LLDGVEHVPLDLYLPQDGIAAMLEVLGRRVSDMKREDLLVALLLVTVLAFILTQEEAISESSNATSRASENSRSAPTSAGTPTSTTDRNEDSHTVDSAFLMSRTIL
jgi:hypothetical protein